MSVHPDAITVLTDEGCLVAVLDRPPLAGELGWWVGEDDDLEDMLDSVLDGTGGVDTCDGFGWPADRDHDDTVGNDGLRAVTVVADFIGSDPW